MTDEIQALFQHIGQLVVASAPAEKWDIITLNIKVISSFIERMVFYVQQEQQFIPKTFGIKDKQLEYDERVTPSFEKLRQLMYNEAPFRGAWYTAVMTITSAGKFDTEFNYDDKPDFDYPSDDAEYARDFEQFPRNKESTPEWLKEIVQAHNLHYHEPEPLA